MDVGFDAKHFSRIYSARENSEDVETNKILARVQSFRCDELATVERLNSYIDTLNREGLQRRKRYALGDDVTLTVLPTQRIKQRINVRQSKSKRNKFDTSIGGYVSEYTEDVDVLKSPLYVAENHKDFSYIKHPKQQGRKAVKPKGGYFSISRLDSSYRHRGDSSKFVRHTTLKGHSYDFAQIVEHEGEYQFSILPNENTTPYVLQQFFKWTRRPSIELIGAYIFNEKGWEFKHVKEDTLFLCLNVPERADFMQFFSRFDDHELVRLSDHTENMSPLLAQYFQGFGEGLLYAKHSDGIGIYRECSSLPGYLSKWFSEYPVAPKMIRAWKDKKKSEKAAWRKAGIRDNKPGKIKSSYLMG